MIEIRKMAESDISYVAKMEHVIFSDPWSEKVYRETFALAGVEYVVATDPDNGNKITGVAGVRDIVGTGEITNVMVLPEYRGKGIAKTMLKDLIARGRAIGSKEFTLEVRAGNAVAIKLYEDLGFVSEGIRPGFYNNPKEDAVIMWLRQ